MFNTRDYFCIRLSVSVWWYILFIQLALRCLLLWLIFVGILVRKLLYFRFAFSFSVCVCAWLCLACGFRQTMMMMVLVSKTTGSYFTIFNRIRGTSPLLTFHTSQLLRKILPFLWSKLTSVSRQRRTQQVFDSAFLHPVWLKDGWTDLARSAINIPDWFKSGWKKVSDRTLFYPGKASWHCYLFWWNAGNGTLHCV